MLKKVVVVVDEDKKEVFFGEILKVEEQFGATEAAGFKSEPKLIVRDGDKVLAEFQVWMYWRETE